MYTVMNGKELAAKIRTELKEEVQRDNIKAKLAVIQIGNDPASKIYVRNKSKACEEVGIEFEEFKLPSTVSQKELFDTIALLDVDLNTTGILLQSPIPKHLDIQEAFSRIDWKKDVDGFNPINIGKRTIGEDAFIPCTTLGIIKLLEEYNIDITGKKVVVLGRSNIVGKPTAIELLKRNATVTVCHSKTKDLYRETEQADILISAIGKPKFITADMIKKDAIVIDVGMNKDENNKLCGDIDYNEAVKKVSYITPVPGGIGPMTIAMLMNNVIKAYKLQHE